MSANGVSLNRNNSPLSWFKDDKPNGVKDITAIAAFAGGASVASRKLPTALRRNNPLSDAINRFQPSPLLRRTAAFIGVPSALGALAGGAYLLANIPPRFQSRQPIRQNGVKKLRKKGEHRQGGVCVRR
jgi:hypothetical protein